MPGVRELSSVRNDAGCLAAVFLTATLATVAGCGASTNYSQKQVKSAFKTHGIRLTALVADGTKVKYAQEPALRP